jgi:hypothetical protein
MFERRRFKQRDTLANHLAEEAKRLREQARLLRPGSERDVAVRKARQAEVGTYMSEWLLPPGLEPPK